MRLFFSIPQELPRRFHVRRILAESVHGFHSPHPEGALQYEVGGYRSATCEHEGVVTTAHLETRTIVGSFAITLSHHALTEQEPIIEKHVRRGGGRPFADDARTARGLSGHSTAAAHGRRMSTRHPASSARNVRPLG